jgi:hypothetical protein
MSLVSLYLQQKSIGLSTEDSNLQANYIDNLDSRVVKINQLID